MMRLAGKYARTGRADQCRPGRTDRRAPGPADGTETDLLAWHRSNEPSQRLSTIPEVGLASATALAASFTDAGRFRSGRQFAASRSLTPLQNSSGGKERMGRI